VIAQFKIELDLHLIYIPPMEENSPGVVVTRMIELPFVPYNGLRIFSRTWEEDPEPYGLELKDLVWDTDREVFLATAVHISHDFPIALIPNEIRYWLERGWRWGSYSDQYHDGEVADTVVPVLANGSDDLTEGVSDAEVDSLHTLPVKKRPPAFNSFFKALIRHMAASYTNLESAYAMDKTGRYLGSGRVKPPDEEIAKKWQDYQLEYQRQSFDEHMKWRRKVQKYPELSAFVIGTTNR
jgi:hypothetical protein